MDHAALNRSQAPRMSQADDDRAITGPGARKAVTRLLELIAEMKETS